VRSPTLARATFAVTALLVLVGVVVAVGVAIDAGNEPERFSDLAWSRALNVFAFFTVQSNLIVGATCLLLALDPGRDSVLFRLFRLAGVIDIAITGVVYQVALADLHELDGKAAVADQILHAIVPILAVLGWLVLGPRGLATRADALRAMVVPGAWLVFTMLRGPIVDWYPYGFMDVTELGYPRVLVNLLLVAALFGALALGAVALDRRLDRRSS
jgi:hypothetical protein